MRRIRRISRRIWRDRGLVCIEVFVGAKMRRDWEERFVWRGTGRGRRLSGIDSYREEGLF